MNAKHYIEAKESWLESFKGCDIFEFEKRCLSKCLSTNDDYLASHLWPINCKTMQTIWFAQTQGSEHRLVNVMLQGVRRKVCKVVKAANQLPIRDLITAQPAHPRLQEENFWLSQLFYSLRCDAALFCRLRWPLEWISNSYLGQGAGSERHL